MLQEIELKKSHQVNNRAFSILELAIAVSMIALIMSMVSGGMKFMESAKLKSIYAEATKYKKAKNDFFDKYSFLPGDFPHSDKFFGTKCDATATNCNGDGNGHIRDINGSNLNAANYSEPLLFWRHLGLSGLISGNYMGKAVTTVDGMSCNNHFLCCLTSGASKACPASAYNQGIWQALSMNTGSSGVCDDTYGIHHVPSNMQVFRLGSFRDNASAANGFISPQKAFIIDRKFDDGSPTTGLIHARSGVDESVAEVGPCMKNSSGSTFSNLGAYGVTGTRYNELGSAESCALYFINTNNIACPLP